MARRRRVAFLRIETAEEIHAAVLLPGEQTHTLSRGALESAMRRPEWLAQFGSPDIHDLAAALIVGIARAHAFANGNKRTALVVGIAFLFINGHPTDISDDRMGKMVCDAATGALREAEMAALLRASAVPKGALHKRAPRKGKRTP